TLNDTSRVCFSVAACAFVAALCGLAVGHVFSGWMAAGGMSAVGLFYLAIGIFSLSPTTSNDDEVAEALTNAVNDVDAADDQGVEGSAAAAQEPRRVKHLREPVGIE